MKTVHRTAILALISLLLLSFLSPVQAVVLGRDTGVPTEIKGQLRDFMREGKLCYPRSVIRFYSRNGFQPVWVKVQTDTKQTWEAMLLLDCVLQFGLSNDDYHPKELSYDRLHIILEKPDQVNANEKARYDIMLTDALVALMDHLHYGKLNPVFSASQIDAGIAGGFCAEDALEDAIQQANFTKTVLNVQPKAQAYTDLQYHMHLLEGLYQGDCYEVPVATIRKMAINMERLRWVATDNANSIQINIPSYTLRLCRLDTAYNFKVAVGKPSAPTPTLQSAVNYFTTAPEKKINRGPAGSTANWSARNKNEMGTIYFWFTNKQGITLKGTPGKQMFKKDERDLTNGGIKVGRGQQLAELLLKFDGAENKIKDMHAAIGAFQVKNFILNKPVPLIITYITCEMKNGVLVTYKDIYNLDKGLEMAMYNVPGTLALR